jgi:predicted alpha/beta superfamily hydrolase
MQGPGRLAVLVALAAAIVAAPANAAVQLREQIAPVRDGREGGAETLVLHSDALGRDVTIDVTAPPSSAASVKAAAVYVLDRGMRITGQSALILQGSGEMAPAFIVAISSSDAGADRKFDLVHGRVGQGKDAFGGGGDAFEAFLVDELKPFIEARYPVDPARSVLYGHSLGGLFAATVLERHPGAFSGYLLASPSIWANPSLIEGARRMAPLPGPTRVFIGYGVEEGPSMSGPAHQLAQALATAQSALQVRETGFEGQNHMSSFLLEGPAGLPFLLPPVPQGR